MKEQSFYQCYVLSHRTLSLRAFVSDTHIFLVLQSGRSSPFVPISTPPCTPAAVETTQLSSLPGHSPSVTAKTSTTTVLTSTGSSQPITVQIQHTEQGPRLVVPSGGFLQIVQTPTGQQLIATSQAGMLSLKKDRTLSI